MGNSSSKSPEKKNNDKPPKKEKKGKKKKNDNPAVETNNNKDDEQASEINERISPEPEEELTNITDENEDNISEKDTFQRPSSQLSAVDEKPDSKPPSPIPSESPTPPSPKPEPNGKSHFGIKLRDSSASNGYVPKKRDSSKLNSRISDLYPVVHAVTPNYDGNTSKKGKSSRPESAMDANVDPAFRGIARDKPAFLTWRIENFKPVPVPKDNFGSFYEGDSYIILVIKESKGTLDAKIHYWLGESTTQDESGTAAIKTVELDDYLGGYPVQYREVQGRESKVFLGLFKNYGGVKYLQGGAASGFTHVDHVFKPRLMHVKGKSRPRFKQITIGWENMNEGDVYILDIGEALFVWNGKKSSRTEKIKAMEYARKMRDDRGKGEIVVIEQGEERQMSASERKLFAEYLPMDKMNLLKTDTEGGCDDEVEKKFTAELKLWLVSDASGSLDIKEVAKAPLKKSMLDPDDCFIVDNGEYGIWVWCGSKATPNEKKGAMSNAMEFLKKRNLDPNTPIIKVHDKGETTEFRALFQQWEKDKLPGDMGGVRNSRIAKTVQTKFDASSMHAHPDIAKETGMVDDGKGEKQIWRVEKTGNTYDLVEISTNNFGQLYGGDSYVIQYSFFNGGRKSYILYFWLGRHSTSDEKGVAAKKTVELDDKLDGMAKQVRVVHGKEPNHFLSMFQGKLIIFSGGKAGWGQENDEGPGEEYMLHVRGTSEYNTRAEQVKMSAESLNSNDCFVIFSKSGIYIWAGKGATGDEREMAKQIATISPNGYTMVVEGTEKEEFWNILGGKKPYCTSDKLASQVSMMEQPPRLFQCSNASGRFIAEEISDFAQVDLVSDDVFILDTFDQIYIWVGNEAREDEKKAVFPTVEDYIKSDPSGRDLDIAVFKIDQGREPPDFVGYFGIWDRELWSGGKTYDELKKEMNTSNTSIEKIALGKGDDSDKSFSDVKKVTYAVLKRKEGLPSGIDVNHKEKHLEDSEFKTLFKMSYPEFVRLPAWKQTRLKQQAKLF